MSPTRLFFDVIIGSNDDDLFIESIWLDNITKTRVSLCVPIVEESKLKLALLNDDLILAIYRHTSIMDYVSISNPDSIHYLTLI